MKETHLAWTKSIYISFPLVFEGDGSAGSCCVAEPAPPSTSPDIANNITVAADLLILARSIVDNRVDPASELFPAVAAMTRNVITGSTLLHGNVKVPCYDETIARASVENTFRGRATDELCGRVECERGDAEAMARFVIAGGMRSRLGRLCRVGDQDGVDRALSVEARWGEP